MVLAKTNLFSARQVELAGIARSLGHPARIAIVGLLLERERMSCRELVEALPLAQATVSQHLVVLRRAGLLRGTSCGTQVCYSLDSERVTAFCREFRESLGQD